MKSTPDELFLLIKSLTAQEKLYFKAFSVNKRERSKSSGYLQLFNVMNRMKVFDKKKLRSNLEKIGFKNTIKESKRRATEAILKSLTDYNPKLNKDIELQQLIHRIHVLVEKKLLDMAFKLLVKAKKIALDNERYSQLLILSGLEESILREKSDVSAFENYNKSEAEKKVKYSECLKNVSEYKNLSLLLSPIILQQSKSNAEDHTKTIRQILRHTLLQNPASAITLQSLELYYYIKFRCSFLLNKIGDDDYNDQMNWLACIERDKSKLANYRSSYLITISNLIVAIRFTGKVEKLDFIFNKALLLIQSIPEIEKTSRLLSTAVNVFGNYMDAQLNIPDPKGVLNVWEKLKDFGIYKVTNPSNLITLHANMVQAYFLLNHFKEALHFVNKIINEKNNIMQDAQRFARLNLLMINYELKKHELLPYIVKSAKNYLVKNNIAISQFDKCVLNYFERKLPEINNKQVEKAVFN
ncbi:MAG: hypothetical protein HYU69_09995 [Bacteroidetes bacterium]|nr:hypothetical protein [Bacteroidota bacterium]